MNPAIALALVTFALQAVALLIATAISRAPGWGRIRIVTLLAATAMGYSLSGLLGWMFGQTDRAVFLVVNTNLVFAAIHVSAWLWFGHADAEGSWRTLPAWVRRLALGSVAFAAIIAIPGWAHSQATATRVEVETLGFSFVRVTLTPLGQLAAGLILVVLLLALVRQVAEMRRGVEGSRAVVMGFAVFVACGVEEIAVAADWIDFMFLAELGYLALVIPVTAQFLRRFVDDAHRLEEYSAVLRRDVRTANAERDAARQALEVQERFASLGRIAGGIGHEINNPLQILALNLEEIGARHLRDAGPRARETLAQAAEAADRIGGVVAAVRAYAQPLVIAREPIAPRDVVEAAVRQARAHLRGEATIRVSHEPAPAIVGDPDRLAQLVAAGIANAAKVLGPRGAFGEIQLRTASGRSQEAVIEIADNGPGYPARVVEQLHDFVSSTREASGASGLGLFVARSIVDAHGGALELGRSAMGGALFRLRLPAAPQTTAVASISTRAPGSISPAT